MVGSCLVITGGAHQAHPGSSGFLVYYTILISFLIYSCCGN
jgi:hypothetical protein